MIQNNLLTKLIQTSDTMDNSLDALCKKLLSHRSILTQILKTCVEEFKNCSLQEIEQHYIEGDPSINSVPVHQDDVPKPEEFITGIRNKNNSILERTITYDISFKVIHPLSSTAPI